MIAATLAALLVLIPAACDPPCLPVGMHTFTLIVRDEAGRQTSRSHTVFVTGPSFIFGDSFETGNTSRWSEAGS